MSTNRTRLLVVATLVVALTTSSRAQEQTPTWPREPEAPSTPRPPAPPADVLGLVGEYESAATRGSTAVHLYVIERDGTLMTIANRGAAVSVATAVPKPVFVRGPGVISAYFDNPAASAAAFDKDGWFGTGDVAKVTPDGYLTLVDRTKDLVKSGGEWISSIDVENEAMACPGVGNAAVIAIPHPKWSERPLLVVVKAAGTDPTREQILAHLSSRLAKWQVPDDVVFSDSLPLTATGKISKKDLRARYADFKLAD